LYIDLDQYIENKFGIQIQNYIQNFGEASFRDIELESFLELQFKYQENSKVTIAVGAGFPVEQIRKHEIIWLRKDDDSTPRIFLDRPRLNPEKTPKEEYLQRYRSREALFAKCANRTLTLLNTPTNHLSFHNASLVAAEQ